MPYISVPSTAGALDRANGEQVGVAACCGVRECCTGGGQGEEVVGEKRSADLDRSAPFDVVGGDDAPGTASGDARLHHELINCTPTTR
jgi:hypothetical protein